MASDLSDDRARWATWATVAAGEALLAVALLHVLVGWPRDVWVAAVVVAIPIPVALILATWPRTSGASGTVLARTIRLTALGCVLLASAIVMLLALGRSPTGAERAVVVAALVATGAGALLFRPLQDRFDAIAAGLVDEEPRTPDALLAVVSRTLSQPLPLDEVLVEVTQSLRTALALTAAELWVNRDGVLHLVASDPYRARRRAHVGAAELRALAGVGIAGRAWLRVWLPSLLEGREDGPVRVAPIVSSDELLGLLAVERGPGGEDLSDVHQLALAELARRIGLVLRSARLDVALHASLDELRSQAEQLRSSRSRVVAAGDAERRRIEHDLHDGAQQDLVALAINLRLARDLVSSDPAAAEEALAQLGRDVDEAIGGMRDLAHGIYPPLLQERGLGDALRAAAARTPIVVSFETEGVGRHPADVESAVYFCCLEALQNVAKHVGRDARVVVRVEQRDGQLVFEVIDDGPGFEPTRAGAGVGLAGMEDRLGALGGTLQVDAAPQRGTCVRGIIPVSP